MENDNGIPKEPAEKEFALIKDLLSVPQEDKALLEHRRWHGGCLFFHAAANGSDTETAGYLDVKTGRSPAGRLNSSKGG